MNEEISKIIKLGENEKIIDEHNCYFIKRGSERNIGRYYLTTRRIVVVEEKGLISKKWVFHSDINLNDIKDLKKRSLGKSTFLLIEPFMSIGLEKEKKGSSMVLMDSDDLELVIYKIKTEIKRVLKG